MPRDVAFLDAYIPAIVLLFMLGAAITWVLDPFWPEPASIGSCGTRPSFA
ncbi:hypothetical protein LMG27952_07348 [Paraburkholderia hiiakae]|uniref:Uncharacterized protein n=1 Tax=Paraburkholderia hiiakae TaxID=1081782 RepID=A0ABN7IIG1_9BURK|nr:hypothetical protein LMG27952_07348 [Paraburkholderia hiiakae]